jgi:trehalose-6-phosphate synthase
MQHLIDEFNCHPVFLGAELKTNFYKKFCKQQMWPILHYLIPLSPNSLGRFDPNLWSAYVRANMAFANKLVEVSRVERLSTRFVAGHRSLQEEQLHSALRSVCLRSR